MSETKREKGPTWADIGAGYPESMQNDLAQQRAFDALAPWDHDAGCREPLYKTLLADLSVHEIEAVALLLVDAIESVESGRWSEQWSRLRDYVERVAAAAATEDAKKILKEMDRLWAEPNGSAH